MNFKGKDCIIHVPQRLAGMDERVDNSCKRRAEYLRRSLIIVCRERGQWQASFVCEKSVCLAEVSVTEQILVRPCLLGLYWEYIKRYSVLLRTYPVGLLNAAGA